MRPPDTVQRYYSISDGLRLAADVGGDASRQSVVLLHGGGQTRHSWRGVVQELLRHGYHVLNIDARGHGDSDWAPDADYRFESLASDLRAVIATLPNAPALVGASMGGITALLAIAGADRTIAKALVLVDVVPRLEVAGVSKIVSFMRAHADGFRTVEEAAEAVGAYNPNRTRSDDHSGLTKNLRRRDDGRLHWHWDPAFVAFAGGVAPDQFAGQLMQAADKVKVPSLLVRGLDSDVVSDGGVSELHKHMPALEILDVAGAGHMVAGDRNDAFNAGVVAFLLRNVPP